MALSELDLHLTNRCSLRCGHCVFDSGERPLREMDTAAVGRLAGELTAEAGGPGTINLFGGEVLLRRDVVEVVRTVRSAGHAVGITTNCAVPDALLERILSEDLQRITSDLDGATAASHDALRRRDGNFEAVLRLLKLSVAQRIFTTVNSVLHAGNAHEVEDILQLCADTGVSGLAFYYLTPTGRGTGMAGQVLEGDRWMALRERVATWVEAHAPAFPVIWEEAFEPAGTPRSGAWRCEPDAAGSVFIRCDGETYSCALLEGSPRSLGNVLREPLSVVLARRAELGFPHRDGCPALAHHVLGDADLPDPRPCPPTLQRGCPYDCHALHDPRA